MVPGDVSDNSNEPPAGNLVINRPRGLLIHGSPGTGKTRFMKLLATHSRYNSFNIGPEILLNRYFLMLAVHFMSNIYMR